MNTISVRLPDWFLPALLVGPALMGGQVFQDEPSWKILPAGAEPWVPDEIHRIPDEIHRVHRVHSGVRWP